MSRSPHSAQTVCSRAVTSGRKWRRRSHHGIPIPYTIVRIVHANTAGQTIRLSTALLRPMASDDLARAVSDAALAEPVNGIYYRGGGTGPKLASTTLCVDF